MERAKANYGGIIQIRLSSAKGVTMAEIQMTIDSIRYGAQHQDYKCVILREKEPQRGIWVGRAIWRALPIWVGNFEAFAIGIKLEHPPSQIYSVYEFVSDVIKALGATVKSAIITDFQNETFYAQIVVTTNNQEIEIDCRPSDAMAVALRVGSPIFVHDKLLEEHGVILDSLDEEGERI